MDHLVGEVQLLFTTDISPDNNRLFFDYHLKRNLPLLFPLTGVFLSFTLIFLSFIFA